MVIGGMATYPARFETLSQVVDSIVPQIDKLFVYVNQSDSVPQCLKGEPKVIPLLAKEHDGNLSATGKVYPLKLIEGIGESYYFTFDDDFIYPPDYVEKMVGAIEMFDRRAAVTVHGSIFAPEADWYFERSCFFPARKRLNKFRFVTLPGSGTAAFHRSMLRLRYDDFPREPMVDLQFAIAALKQGVPWLCVPRSKDWLLFLGHTGIWEQITKEITHHTTAMMNAGPWSFDRFRPAYNEFVESTNHSARQDLDPSVLSCLQGGAIPADWQLTERAIQARREHDEVLLRRSPLGRIKRLLGAAAR